MTRNGLPPLNSLKAFAVAGRLQSFNLAADELNVTGRAVSLHVQQLEAWLGVTLFIRHARGVELTEDGAAYLRETKEGLDRLELATSRILQKRRRKTLRVNVPRTFVNRWLIPRLAAFHDLHPDIDVRVQTGNEPVEKIGAAFDVAIRAGPHEEGSCRTFEILPSGQLPLCSTKVMAEKPINSVGDLARHTFLHLSDFPDGWARWLAEAGAPGLQPQHAITFDESESAIQAAINGLGLTIAPLAFVADEVAEGRLAAPLSAPFVESWLAWRYRAYVADGRSDDPAVVQFLDWVQEAGQEGPSRRP